MRPGSRAVPVPRPAGPPPVEYAVAVEAFLASASLGPASRRVYRISLASWAWALAGAQPPPGRQRRGAAPPVLPLALLDDQGTAAALAAAVASRAAVTDARTVNRELSALRSAIGWWREQGWIGADPTAGLRHRPAPPAVLPALTAGQLDALFGAGAGLREQALWRMLWDTGASAGEVLGLNAGRLDLTAGRARVAQPLGPGPAFDAVTWISWRRPTTNLVSWLLAGRPEGPVFLTDRKAPAGTPAADVCPFSGRARMSYRRAAEIFTARTRPLDPAGRGWTLHQLAAAGRTAQA